MSPLFTHLWAHWSSSGAAECHPPPAWSVWSTCFGPVHKTRTEFILVQIIILPWLHYTKCSFHTTVGEQYIWLMFTIPGVRLGDKSLISRTSWLRHLYKLTLTCQPLRSDGNVTYICFQKRNVAFIQSWNKTTQSTLQTWPKYHSTHYI